MNIQKKIMIVILGIVILLLGSALLELSGIKPSFLNDQRIYEFFNSCTYHYVDVSGKVNEVKL